MRLAGAGGFRERAVVRPIGPIRAGVLEKGAAYGAGLLLVSLIGGRSIETGIIRISVLLLGGEVEHDSRKGIRGESRLAKVRA